MDTAMQPSGPPVVTQRSATSKTSPAGAHLTSIDFENDHERTTLYTQRVACGWHKDSIDFWAKAQARGERNMFWITLPADTTHISADKDIAGLGILTRDGHRLLLVGHISLDKQDPPSPGRVDEDDTLTASDGSVLTITSLYVLPAYASLGLGAFAMDGCERLAQSARYGSDNCRAVTLTTLAPRYFPGGLEGPDGMGIWERLGLTTPGRDNMPWYVRRGYVRYQEKLRYAVSMDDGTKYLMYASYMRKELGEPLVT